MQPGSDSTEAEAQIRALLAYCDELEDAMDELAHEARRCRDRLERVGGASHQLTRELKRLEDNWQYNEKELDQARRRIEALRKESD